MRIKREKQLPKSSLQILFVLLMGLIFLGPFSFAQDSEVPSEGIQVEENHDTKKLDKVLEDYNKDEAKVLQDAEKIYEMGKDEDVDPELDPTLKKAELGLFDSKKWGKKERPLDLKKVKYAEAMRVALKPLQTLDEKHLVKLLQENSKGTRSEVYIERYPKVAVFAVRLIKDPNALPNLAQIVDEEEKLIRFGGFMLATVLVGFMLKRFMKKEGRSVLAALGVWFLRFSIMTTLRFGVIMYFYTNELSPIFSIASKTFF